MTAPTVSDAMVLAIQSMGPGRVDKAGHDYALHLMAVATKTRDQLHARGMNPNDPEVLIAAVLHDTLEDTKVTASGLLLQGYTERTVKLVKILTRVPGQSYGEYLMGIKMSGLKEAIAIKVADAQHNGDMTRMLGVTPTEKRVAANIKYALVLEFFRADTAAEAFGALAAIELVIGGEAAAKQVSIMVKGYAVGSDVPEGAAAEVIQLEALAASERAGDRVKAETARAFKQKLPA